MDKVNQFKELYRNREFKKCVQLVLAGWGNNEESLNDKQHALIDVFVKTTPTSMQNSYYDLMAGSTGTFR